MNPAPRAPAYNIYYQDYGWLDTFLSTSFKLMVIVGLYMMFFISGISFWEFAKHAIAGPPLPKYETDLRNEKMINELKEDLAKKVGQLDRMKKEGKEKSAELEGQINTNARLQIQLVEMRDQMAAKIMEMEELNGQKEGTGWSSYLVFFIGILFAYAIPLAIICIFSLIYPYNPNNNPQQ